MNLNRDPTRDRPSSTHHKSNFFFVFLYAALKYQREATKSVLSAIVLFCTSAEGSVVSAKGNVVSAKGNVVSAKANVVSAKGNSESKG